MYAAGLQYALYVNTIWMGWNLFLAFIPFVFAKRLFRHTGKLNLAWLIGFFFFVLFIPNAPYVFTDVIHLKTAFEQIESTKALALVGGQFAVFLLLGYWLFAESYRSFEDFLHKKYDIRHYGIRLVSFVILSVGIYLGRFLRFNSWDIFTHPLRLLRSIDEVFEPKALVFIGLCTVFLFLAYTVYEFTRKVGLLYKLTKNNALP